MKLIVNDRRHDHQGDGSLASLLAEMGAHPDRVAVAVNNEVIARASRDSIRLTDGDRVDVLRLAAGG